MFAPTGKIVPILVLLALRIKKMEYLVNLSHSPSACRGVTDWSKSKETAQQRPLTLPSPASGRGEVVHRISIR
jgi:hypothetical protein